MNWKFWNRPAVESYGYTDVMTERLVGHVSSSTGRIQDTALVRSIGGLYRRSFDRAAVDGLDNVDIDLARLVESMIVWGHGIGIIDVDAGLRVRKVWPSDMSKSKYRIGGRWIPSEGVVHLRMAEPYHLDGPHGDDQVAPHEDLWWSHWDAARTTVDAYLKACQYMVDEFSIPASRFLPADSLLSGQNRTPTGRTEQAEKAERDSGRMWLKMRDKELRGNLSLIPNLGTASRPGRSVDPAVVGPQVPQWVLEGIQALEERLAGIVGVPMAILGHVRATGTDSADADRLWRHTLQATAARVARELSAKLERDVSIHWPAHRAQDARSAASAVKALAEAGIRPEDAMVKVGL